MVDETKLSAEQLAAKDAQEADIARGSLVSTRWLRARLNHGGPTFKVCPENAGAIGDYVKTHNLSWSEDSLDEAYAALKDIPGALIFEQDTPAPKVSASSEPVAPEFPWNKRLTKQSIDDMPREDYKKWLLSKKYGAEFRLQVDAALREGL